MNSGLSLSMTVVFSLMVWDGRLTGGKLSHCFLLGRYKEGSKLLVDFILPLLTVPD